jgi:hypothetical protein
VEPCLPPVAASIWLAPNVAFFWVAGGVAAVATAFEALSPHGIDNVTLPLAAPWTAWGLTGWRNPESGLEYFLCLLARGKISGVRLPR